MEPVLLNTAQAAARLGLTEYQIQSAYRSKALPCRRIGRLVRFTQDDLDAFVERAKTGEYQPPRRGGRRTA